MSAAQYATQLDQIAERVEQPPRFWAKVDKNGPDGCWLWTAARSDTGYGSFRINHRTYTAHRLAYEELVGPIPAGLQIDHLCKVRACVNPSHLEPVTHAENSRRAHTIGYGPATPATCQRGHDWTETPPLIAQRAGGRTSRTCRICARARDRRRTHRSRGRAA